MTIHARIHSIECHKHSLYKIGFVRKGDSPLTVSRSIKTLNPKTVRSATSPIQSNSITMSSFFCPSAIMASATPLFHHAKFPARPLLRCLHNSTNISTSTRHFPQLKRFPQTTLSTRRTYKTVEEARSRTHSGPFSIRSAILFLTAGACMIVYFRFEKDRVARQRIAEASKGVGKPKVGGKFELADQEGRKWTEEALKGGFTLVGSLFSFLFQDILTWGDGGVLDQKF